MPDLCFATATELLKLIRSRSVSVYEVVEAHIAQIERLNPVVNAVVTFLPEQALSRAKKIDQLLAKGKPVGRLSGLPIAIKIPLQQWVFERLKGQKFFVMIFQIMTLL